MSITTELRDFVDGLACHKVTRDMLREIADRIDREHEECEDFCRRLEDAASKGEEVTIFGIDYMPLPKGADGLTIRVGDTVVDWKTPRTVAAVSKDSICLSGYEYDSYYRMGIAKDYRHHHEPTVEDVLREFYVLAVRGKEAHAEDVDEGVLVEYAAKLRLAGEAE